MKRPKCEDCSDGSCVNCALDERTRQLAKARARIVELEALVISADTVSKAEYAAMVKQRDTMRDDLKTARHLLVDALGWLRLHGHEGVGLSEWLEGQEFFDLMQAYRHAPIATQVEVTRRFEAIKARLVEFAPEDEGALRPELSQLISTIEALPPFRA